MINGPTPLRLIDAPDAGSGKGLLADVLSRVSTGREAAVTVLSKDEDEVDKRVTALLSTGTPFILLDNVTSYRIDHARGRADNDVVDRPHPQQKQNAEISQPRLLDGDGQQRFSES